MGEAEQREFLARFADEDGRGIGFAVLGGAFSEGIDLPGRRLIGAFVATLGLPQLNPVNEQIRARMQLHYAGNDAGINAGMAAYEAALKSAGVRYEQYVYPNVEHAFHNDTSAARYDKAAAELAWSRTVAFLKAALS